MGTVRVGAAFTPITEAFPPSVTASAIVLLLLFVVVVVVVVVVVERKLSKRFKATPLAL